MQTTSSMPASRPHFSFSQRINQFYTLGEEIANAVTHGIGALLAVAAATVLLFLALTQGSPLQIASFAIYGVSVVTLFLASTLYHTIQHPTLRRPLRILDHSAIYVMIAGSYTPFLLIGLRGVWGWTLFAVVWGLALIGIGFKILYIGRYERLSTIGYVLMGWLAVIAAREMMQAIPLPGLLLLAAGGVCFTVGVLFFRWERLPYNHAIWHLFVLAGSALHFFAITHLLPANACFA